MKYTLKAIGIFAFYYGCIYAFNHINAWLGILAAVLFTSFLITYLFNKTQTKNEK